jgi:hypothetical protein
MKRVFHGWVALVTAAVAWGAEPVVPEPKQFQLGEPVVHFGCCDASAGVAISSNLFIMANDEDNRLSVYRRDESGPPLQTFAAGAFLHVDPLKPESDIEAATRDGDRIYWITSHGRNRSGEARESRHRFFATNFRVNEQGRVELKTVGQPYTRLLDDLLREPRLAPFNLLGASRRAPKEAGGLSIEGLCTTTNGELLIGFRNPIPGHRAVLVPLKNPADLIAGGRAQFGDPILLDLGGLGVRDMLWAHDRCLIIAGPFDGKGHFHLYEWDGRTAEPRRIPETHFRDLNPEALLAYPGAPTNEFQLLSDDGTRRVAGEECKKIKDPARQRFRSYWVRLE